MGGRAVEQLRAEAFVGEEDAAAAALLEAATNCAEAYLAVVAGRGRRGARSAQSEKNVSTPRLRGLLAAPKLHAPRGALLLAKKACVRTRPT